MQKLTLPSRSFRHLVVKWGIAVPSRGSSLVSQWAQAGFQALSPPASRSKVWERLLLRAQRAVLWEAVTGPKSHATLRVTSCCPARFREAWSVFLMNDPSETEQKPQTVNKHGLIQAGVLMQQTHISTHKCGYTQVGIHAHTHTHIMCCNVTNVIISSQQRKPVLPIRSQTNTRRLIRKNGS